MSPCSCLFLGSVYKERIECNGIVKSSFVLYFVSLQFEFIIGNGNIISQ